MTNLLNEDIIKQVRELFDGLKNPVQIMFFGSQEDCEYCDDTRKLVEEVADISNLVSFEVYDLEADAELADKYNVDKAPGLVFAAKDGDQITDFGVRMAGIPAGHEFSSLVHDIVLVSNRDSGLNSQTREFLKSLERPILLQVFVTPT